MYPFRSVRCHALSLTSVLCQVTHRRRVLVLSVETIEQLDKGVSSFLTPLAGLNIVLCGDPAPVPTLPLYAYRGHMAS